MSASEPSAPDGGPGDAHHRLHQRYGRPSRRGHRTRLTVVVVAAIVLAAWAVWAGWSHSRPQLRGELRAFQVVSAHRIEVHIAVFRPDGSAVACTVEALATDHSSVGEEVWRLPKGNSGTFPLAGTIRTTREATSADVVGCHAIS